MSDLREGHATTSEIPLVVPAVDDFASFYRHGYQQVARALGITLGDWDLGAEAADEAMARCYAHWRTVRTYENPPGWVYRVGLNWARSTHRRRQRRYPYADRLDIEQPPVADPQIQRALEKLDVRLRAVIVCRFYLDLSTKATAEALGIRPGTVKSRVSRGLERLEALLAHFRQE